MTDNTEPTHKVVVNHEDQYAIWPAGRENPAGWLDEGTRGTEEDCASRVEQIWTDLRPRSLRSHMASVAQPGSSSTSRS